MLKVSLGEKKGEGFGVRIRSRRRKRSRSRSRGRRKGFVKDAEWWRKNTEG